MVLCSAKLISGQAPACTAGTAQKYFGDGAGASSSLLFLAGASACHRSFALQGLHQLDAAFAVRVPAPGSWEQAPARGHLSAAQPRQLPSLRSWTQPLVQQKISSRLFPSLRNLPTDRGFDMPCVSLCKPEGRWAAGPQHRPPSSPASGDARGCARSLPRAAGLGNNFPAMEAPGICASSFPPAQAEGAAWLREC